MSRSKKIGLCVVGESSGTSAFVTIEVLGSVWLKEYLGGLKDAIADLRRFGLVDKATSKRVSEHFSRTKEHFVFSVEASIDQPKLLTTGFRRNGGVISRE